MTKFIIVTSETLKSSDSEPARIAISIDKIIRIVESESSKGCWITLTDVNPFRIQESFEQVGDLITRAQQ